MKIFRYLLVPFSWLLRKDLILFCETHRGSGSNVYSLYSAWSSDPSLPFKCRLIQRNVNGLRNRIRYEWLLLSAGWIVQDHGGRSWYPGQRVIELWHGIPLKVMDWMDTNQQTETAIRRIGHNTPDIVLSCSRIYETLLSACRFIPVNRYRRFGFPRLNWLETDRSEARFMLTQLVEQPISDEEKVLLWMPTHRNLKSNGNHNGDSRVPSLLDAFLTPEFERTLERHRAILLMKPHPNDEPLVRKQVASLGSRVKLLTSESCTSIVDDLYCLLPGTDALITDYSSVFFDYLLLDKPIAFVVDDIDAYRGRRGFLLEPVERWMPGQLVESASDLQKFIAGISRGDDRYATDRMEMRNAFFPQGIQNSALLLKEHILNLHH